MSTTRTIAAVTALALAALATASAAGAADPGRWEAVTHTGVPLEYFQGIAADPGGPLYFDGIYTGVFRAVPTRLSNGTWTTVETGRNPDVIPPEVTAAEGYEHAGDLTWAPTKAGEEPALAALLGDSGRLLLPLECWIVTQDADENVCPDDSRIETGVRPSTGAIGVVDARTLTWQYYVKLAEGALRKAMWLALSPNGKLLWTQGGDGTELGEPGRDLLAFRTADVVEANESVPGAAGKKLEPKVILRGAVPEGASVTGATFFDGRLYLAAQTELSTTYLLRVWSLDVDSCSIVTACDRRLEIERELIGESEGLTVACTFGDGVRHAVLHWLVAPYNQKHVPTFWEAPYFHVGQSTVMSFRPTSGDGVARVCRG